jgi:hypothetical protein
MAIIDSIKFDSVRTENMVDILQASTILEETLDLDIRSA